MRLLSLFRSLPFVLPLLAGCHSTSISVHATHDAGFDFTKVQTFGWQSMPATVDTAIHDQSVADMIRREMENKGIRYTPSGGDLLVAIHRTLTGQLNTRGGGYEAVAGGRMEYYTLQEGMLVVDLIAASDHHLVWRGTAEGVFKFGEDSVKKQQMMSEVLHDMFAGFPPR